jgi:hypothetical protein
VEEVEGVSDDINMGELGIIQEGKVHYSALFIG